MHGEMDVAGAQARKRMLQALRNVAGRAGGPRQISGLSLMAVLCASAVAPVALVGQTVGPVIATWLATAGSIGSNVLADVIVSVVSRRSPETARDVETTMEGAVADELEARMAGPGPKAAELRGAVAGLLRERGAQQVLTEAMAEADDGLQVALAESVTLLAGRFDEFMGLLSAVRTGVGSLQQTAAGQQVENRTQAQYRGQALDALDRILQLLGEGTSPADEAGIVYNTLPSDVAAFTGRNSEINEIAEQIAATAAHSTAVNVHVIDGMPGVGKSALAVHVAHLLSNQFPDRQLFVDLHAHTAGKAPADPAATLADLLASDGLDPRHLPAELQKLAALWRARMAGRRALLVLDNAADSAQVAPLLPGGADTLVLITSRRHLGDLPCAVATISLDLLPPRDAVEMFMRVAPRGSNQQEQVANLVSLAGHLPLAISLLARVYARHPSWSLLDLIEETRARLLTLSAEHDTVAAAFDLSYKTLNPARQRFFRLLGLHPGGDLDPYAAAALTGTTLTQATKHLDALHGDHLLTEPARRRYRMHDLLRAHARSQTERSDPIEQREASLDGLLCYYSHTAKSASVPVARLPRTGPDAPGPAYSPDLADPEAARAWLRTEHTNMEACYTYASTQTPALENHAIALAAGLAEILQTHGPHTHALKIHQTIAETAARRNQPTAHATALNDLGRVRYTTGDYPGAAAALKQALQIYQRIDDALGEANALTNLGRVLYRTGDCPAAVDVLERALAIYEQIGNRLGEAHALSDLGQLRFITGENLEAADSVKRAVEIFHQIGNRLGEASALQGLGYVQFMIGDHRGAEDAHVRALKLSHQIGDRRSEASALTHLGRLWHTIGNYPAAGAALARALEIFREVGDRRGEAGALTVLGLVRRATGDVAGAADIQMQALEIYHRIGNRADRAWALTCYAATLIAAGERSRAHFLYQQALDMTRELNMPAEEAICLEGIAEHHIAAGNTLEATERLRQAHQIYRLLGMRPDTQRIQLCLIALENPPGKPQKSPENGGVL